MNDEELSRPYGLPAPRRLSARWRRRRASARAGTCARIGEGYLRREIELVSEMLDPAFGYDPGALRGRAAPTEGRRERFALLWSIYAEGRLARRYGPSGRPASLPPGFSEEHERLLSAAYPRIPAALRDEVFARLASPCPHTHAELVAMAEGPEPLLKGLGIPWAETRGPTPGARCPLCAFPTHAWAAMPLPAALEQAVRANHRGWDAREGLCARCAELYAAVPAPPGAP